MKAKKQIKKLKRRLRELEQVTNNLVEHVGSTSAGAGKLEAV